MGDERQLGFGRSHTVVVVKDLITGERSLERRPVSRHPSSKTERSALVENWWIAWGWGAFLKAAQGWRVFEGAKLAEASGQSVEYGSAQVTDADVQADLRKAFCKTLFTKITSMDIAGRVKQQATAIKLQDPLARLWMGSFLEKVVDILGEVRGLSDQTKANLKAYLVTDRLTNF